MLKQLQKIIALIIVVTFTSTSIKSPAYAQTAPGGAEDFSVNKLPVPGTMLGESVPFAPLALKGLVINPHKPLEFQFIVDTGKGPQDASSVKTQANQLVKYFLAGLTIPEGDLWVNLSPYEKNRMVPAALGQTDLGRDLLAQDYILKQLTASLIYPERDLGRKFWSKVYAKAQTQFGTTNVPVNTFNKVWILPDQAQVFENGAAAYVTKSTLKVMLDEDYLALQKHVPSPSMGRVREGGIASQIIRQIVLPEITKEVNTGKNFAPLRQIYQALILAKWYKETIQNSLLDILYTNKNKVTGVNLNDPEVKELIYARYLQAYKKGAFNYIKEDPTPGGQIVPRKYFSGGAVMAFRLDEGGRPAGVLSDGRDIAMNVDLEPIDAAMRTKSEKVKAFTNWVKKNYRNDVIIEDTSHQLIRKFLEEEGEQISTGSVPPALKELGMKTKDMVRVANQAKRATKKIDMRDKRRFSTWVKRRYKESVIHSTQAKLATEFNDEMERTRQNIRITERAVGEVLKELGKETYNQGRAIVREKGADDEATAQGGEGKKDAAMQIEVKKGENFSEWVRVNHPEEIIEEAYAKLIREYYEKTGTQISAVTAADIVIKLGKKTKGTVRMANRVKKGVKEEREGKTRFREWVKKYPGKVINRTLSQLVMGFNDATNIWINESTVSEYLNEFGLDIYKRPRRHAKAAVVFPPGGIDLNQIAIKRTGHVIKVQFDPAQLNALEQGGFEGFTPVITGMMHISSPFQLLGVNIAQPTVAYLS